MCIYLFPRLVLFGLSLSTRVNIQLQALYICIWPFIYTSASPLAISWAWHLCSQNYSTLWLKLRPSHLPFHSVDDIYYLNRFPDHCQEAITICAYFDKISQDLHWLNFIIRQSQTKHFLWAKLRLKTGLQELKKSKSYISSKACSWKRNRKRSLTITNIWG